MVGTKTIRAIGLVLALGLILPAHADHPMGANLHFVRDSSRSLEFADLVKSSRGFGTPEEPWVAIDNIDSEGWPQEDAGIILMTDHQGVSGLGGVYEVSFECATTPTIEIVVGDGTIQNVSRNASTGIVTADLIFPENNSGTLMVGFSQTAGGFRDLRVIRPGYDADDVFTNEFLQHLDAFDTLRFMDWTRTNDNESVTWSDRIAADAVSYATNEGVPWEICIDVANRTGADVWVNIPHMADDDYVAQLASLIHQSLAPGRRIYVEYSNEVWNFIFEQFDWNLQAAIAEVANDPQSDLVYDGSTNEYYWAMRRVARRAMEIGAIFKNEFADEINSPVRPVLAHQVINPNWTLRGLDYLDKNYGPPKDYLYAIAGAPYFSVGDVDENSNTLTAEQVLDGLEAAIVSWENDGVLERNAFYAVWYGLSFISYEGGPDTFGPNNVEAKREASLDPRMRDLCLRHLQHWHDWGLGFFTWYTAGAKSFDSNYGTWALVEDLSVPTPKTDALHEIRSSRIVPTAGHMIPSLIDARLYSERDEDWADDPYLRHFDPGEVKDYVVRAPYSGWFTVTPFTATDTEDLVITFATNHAPDDVISVVAPLSEYGLFLPAGSFEVEFEKGLNVIRMTAISGDIDVAYLDICGCVADTNGDGIVDIYDLINVLSTSRHGHGHDPDPSDLIDSCLAFPQALDVLENWGPCGRFLISDDDDGKNPDDG